MNSAQAHPTRKVKGARKSSRKKSHAAHQKNRLVKGQRAVKAQKLSPRARNARNQPRLQLFVNPRIPLFVHFETRTPRFCRTDRFHEFGRVKAAHDFFDRSSAERTLRQIRPVQRAIQFKSASTHFAASFAELVGVNRHDIFRRSIGPVGRGSRPRLQNVRSQPLFSMLPPTVLCVFR